MAVQNRATQLADTRQEQWLYTRGMNDDEFGRWVEMLEQRTGVVVPTERKLFLETNLRLRMRELNVESFEDYRDAYLTGRQGAVEWATLVDRLTVHQTHFFRHIPSFELVRDKLLPEILSSNLENPSFHAWSVGCSTGEEVFSLAMVADDEARRRQVDLRYGIIGTDVSLPALTVAKQGKYQQRQLREIPLPYRDRYCTELGKDEFCMADRLRKRVGFAQLNLIDVARQPLSQLDLIFCQNVLIYFSRSRRIELLQRLVRCLRPGGALILGPGDIPSWSHPELRRIEDHQTLAYRRVAEGTSS